MAPPSKLAGLARLLQVEPGVRLPVFAGYQATTLREQSVLVAEPSVRSLLESRRGSSVVVVLIHPAGGRPLSYRSLREALPPDHRVIGLKDPCPTFRLIVGPGGRYALALESLGRPAHLVGCSLVGVIAAEIARHPDSRFFR